MEYCEAVSVTTVVVTFSDSVLALSAAISHSVPAVAKVTWNVATPFTNVTLLGSVAAESSEVRAKSPGVV